jgi:hypothetical protein
MADPVIVLSKSAFDSSTGNEMVSNLGLLEDSKESAEVVLNSPTLPSLVDWPLEGRS